MALQKASWVFDKEGNRYGWLYGWIWVEINNPTFQGNFSVCAEVHLPRR